MLPSVDTVLNLSDPPYRLQSALLITISVLMLLLIILTAIYSDPWVAATLAALLLIYLIFITIILRRTRMYGIRVSHLGVKEVGADSLGDGGTLVVVKSVPVEKLVRSLSFY